MKQLSYIFGAGLVATLFAACGGPGSAPSVPQPSAAGAWGARPESSCATSACLYVPNFGNDSVTVYAKKANGDVAPLATISGGNTGLNFPLSVALDKTRNLYVSNYGGGSITVYPPGASGNVAPIRTISGSLTQLGGNRGVAVDSNGFIYVVDWQSGPPEVLVFAPGANGNVAPVRVISGSNTGFCNPDGIAVHSHMVYVPDYCAGSASGAVLIFRAKANGNVAPIQTISGSNTDLDGPEAVVVSPVLATAGQIYVASGQNDSVLVFAANANGNVPPIRAISGSFTGLSKDKGIALDSLGEIYASNEYIETVVVFAASANGNVAPIRTISGGNTGLSGPYEIAVH